MSPPEISNLIEVQRTVIDLQEKIVYLESIRVLLPTIVSIIALIVSAWTFFTNYQAKKRELLRQLLNEFASAKNLTEEIGIKMAALLGKKKSGQLTNAEETELSILNSTFEARDENVMNVLESACKAFFDKEVKKADFFEAFGENVELFIKNNTNKYTPPVTSYPKTIQYYETELKKRK